MGILHGESKVALDQDYGEHHVAKIIGMMKKFSTPMGEELDTVVYDKIRLATRSIIVDGALLGDRPYPFAKGDIDWPRDPAHMVRTGVADPLIRTGRFRETTRDSLLRQGCIAQDYTA